MFAIIDVETTGFSAAQEKITEIAIILHDGEKEVERFHTLINPERKIPYRITQLTGINNSMVDGAPRFFEIAKQIIQLTEGHIIVGHNVTFDYNFLRAEFKEFNYDFKRETFCTVRTSRKLLPGHNSYSLPKLTKALNIPHGQQHRALGDAEATSLLFEILLKLDNEINSKQNKKIPTALDVSKIESLPHKTGVYYFYDAAGNVIYVGKSLDIHSRVMQHLNNHSNLKSIEMMNNIHDVKFTITGSELTALLLESNEIKTLKPIFNRAQRRSIFSYGLYFETDLQGYIHLKIDKNEPLRNPLTSFTSAREGKDYLYAKVEEYQLCQKLSDLYKSDGACFDYQIHKCFGACINKENPEDYNERVLQLFEKLQFRHESFFILDRGRELGETAVIQVNKNCYQGFGYIKNEIGLSLQNLRNCIQKKVNNKDTQCIIQSFMRNRTVEIIIGE